VVETSLKRSELIFGVMGSEDGKMYLNYRTPQDPPHRVPLFVGRGINELRLKML